MEDSKNYNDEPVFYCKGCLSLRIKTIGSGLDLDYCDKCGCTDIEHAHIDEWQGLFRKRYGYDYLTKNIKQYGRN